MLVWRDGLYWLFVLCYSIVVAVVVTLLVFEICVVFIWIFICDGLYGFCVVELFVPIWFVSVHVIDYC